MTDNLLVKRRIATPDVAKVGLEMLDVDSVETNDRLVTVSWLETIMSWLVQHLP